MMGVNTRNMYSCLQKCNKLNTVELGLLPSALVELELIHVYHTVGIQYGSY